MIFSSDEDEFKKKLKEEVIIEKHKFKREISIDIELLMDYNDNGKLLVWVFITFACDTI